MTYKPHICMVQSGSGHWGVFAPRSRPRLIGKNNTFRSFDEARVGARHLHLMSNPHRRA